MEFKNKADKMGFYFGKFCVYQFILSMFLGFMIYKYGDYRTGGRWNDN